MSHKLEHLSRGEPLLQFQDVGAHLGHLLGIEHQVRPEGKFDIVFLGPNEGICGPLNNLLLFRTHIVRCRRWGFVQ